MQGSKRDPPRTPPGKKGPVSAASPPPSFLDSATLT